MSHVICDQAKMESQLKPYSLMKIIFNDFNYATMALSCYEYSVIKSWTNANTKL